MSNEEKELLARIGQLAGQINRHKNQQAGVAPSSHQHAVHHRRNTYRHTTHPYAARGSYSHRGRHGHHQHRTLHLNTVSSPAASQSSNENAGTEPGSSRWVTRNDRHRQLINANVYEKESKARTQAIEETNKRKQDRHRRGEKTRFNEYLAHQRSTSGIDVNSNPAAPSNELTIQGIRFRVLDGGKKLSKILDGSNDLVPTPKVATVAGIKFHRTKTGNLVVNRVVQGHRRSGTVRKMDEPCKIFSTTGSCPKGPRCRYVHDYEKVALCKTFLSKGSCGLGDSCDLSHELTPERVPDCLHFAKGHCVKADCPFTHSQSPAAAPVCRAFGFLGYCQRGAECTERHVFECPDFSNTGRCKIKGCKLLHRERASVLRGQPRADDAMEDVSDDDEVTDSDDVDSDEVAEFIDADSDESDWEDRQDFISI